MLVYVLLGVCVVLLGGGVLLLHRVLKLEKNYLVLLQVLAVASPALARRASPQSTQVTLPAVWEDDELFEEASQ